jgi:hypothetical protein
MHSRLFQPLSLGPCSLGLSSDLCGSLFSTFGLLVRQALQWQSPLPHTHPANPQTHTHPPTQALPTWSLNAGETPRGMSLRAASPIFQKEVMSCPFRPGLWPWK